MLGVEGFRPSLVECHLDLVRIEQLGMSLEFLQLIFSPEIIDLLAQLHMLAGHRTMHFIDHSGVAELAIMDGITVAGVTRLLVQLGHFPQGLGRQRSIEDPGATQLAALDQRHPLAKIQSTHGRCETRRAATDDGKIKALHSVSLGRVPHLCDCFGVVIR